ncbi:MAG TPA: hypothetical protein VGR00_06425, partial [Thermoanaerobaculia bacterium]|nr:hypothetical protein [Thermoanaerobaculia bacterium]
RLQALQDLGKASRLMGDFSRSLAAYDQYLALQRYRPVPSPSDLWARLTALPEREGDERLDEWQLDWLFVTDGLAKKVEVLIEMKDFVRARAAVESYLATVFALGDTTAKKSGAELEEFADLNDVESAERQQLQALFAESARRAAVTARDEARYARRFLGTYAVALRKAGHVGEAKRVVAYLVSQPGGDRNLPFEVLSLYNEAKNKGEPLPAAASPWEASEPAPAAPARRRRSSP